MKALLIAVATALIALPAMADSGHGHLMFLGGNLHAHLSWDQGPDGNGGESKMHLEWHDGATHALVEPGQPFSVALYMPDMGHGSAPTQIQRVLDAQGNVITGTYQVSNMYFIMQGSWEVQVTLTKADGSKETETWTVNIGGDAGTGGGHTHSH